MLVALLSFLLFLQHVNTINETESMKELMEMMGSWETTTIPTTAVQEDPDVMVSKNAKSAALSYRYIDIDRRLERLFSDRDVPDDPHLPAYDPKPIMIPCHSNATEVYQWHLQAQDYPATSCGWNFLQGKCQGMPTAPFCNGSCANFGNEIFSDCRCVDC